MSYRYAARNLDATTASLAFDERTDVLKLHSPREPVSHLRTRQKSKKKGVKKTTEFVRFESFRSPTSRFLHAITIWTSTDLLFTIHFWYF